MTDETTEIDEPIQQEQQGHDIETLRQLHSDAQRVLDEEIQTFSDLSSKAIQLAQVNGLILTILIAVANQVSVTAYLNILTGLGTVFLLVSTVLSVWAYSTHEIDVGIGPGVIDRTLEKRPSEAEYRYWILSGVYKDSMADAKMRADKKGTKVRWAICSFLGGLLTIFAGIFHSLHGII